jgi:hypothetical protein
VIWQRFTSSILRKLNPRWHLASRIKFTVATTSPCGLVFDREQSERGDGTDGERCQVCAGYLRLMSPSALGKLEAYVAGEIARERRGAREGARR